MNMRSVRIGARLTIGFSITLALLVFVVVVGNVINARNNHALTAALESANIKIALATDMRSALLQGAIATRNVALQTEVAETQREQALAEAEFKRYAALHEKMVAAGLSPAEKAILDNIARINKDMAEPFVQVIGLALIFDTESAAKVLSSTIDPLNRKAMSEINKLVDIQKAHASEVMLATAVASKELQLQLYLIGAAALAIGMASAWVLTRSITRPLQHAVTLAGQVASGDLTSKVDVVGNDEISELLTALKHMNGNLYESISKVRDGTDTIASASTQIAAGNLDLSSRTEQQASSLEETASSMEELTSTVRQNSDNARQANQLARSASDVALKGGVVVGQVVDTMTSIASSSKRIVDIIGVIEGIAFQTNILSLNAAVEAARAGEQGRGFAVVATEVRSLAQRSANAAKEIKELIDTSVANVDAGTKLVDEAGVTMGEIVDSVKRVTDIMAEILAASQEQTSGIEQINQAISQMDHVTQQNASLVEQAAAAAESLQEQARSLSGVVRAFTLNDTQSTMPLNANLSIRRHDGRALLPATPLRRLA
jgi:methyl-accepting chemotaxis protein